MKAQPKIEGAFQHLAFFQHSKAILKPCRFRKNRYRVGRFKLFITYSKFHGVGIQVEPQGRTTQWWSNTADSSSITDRLKGWQYDLNNVRDQLAFDEIALFTALLAFSPPATPP